MRFSYADDSCVFLRRHSRMSCSRASRSHVYSLANRTAYAWKLRCLLLSHDLSCVELDEHGAVCFELFDRNGEAKVVQYEELQFKMIEFD